MILALPTLALLAITIITSSLTGITKNMFTKSVSQSTLGTWFYVLFQSIACAVLIPILSGGFGTFSVYSMLTGILFGAVCCGQVITLLKALPLGPFSYSMVIVSLATLIPTLSGPFFGETITLSQGFGIVLMVLCVVFSTDKKKEDENRKANAKWLIWCLVSTVLNGMIGVLQKVHQASPHKDELPVFLVSSFVFSAVLCAVMVAVEHKRSPEKEPVPFTKQGVLIPLLGGITLAFPHAINLHLAGIMPAAVMFPLVNICPLMLTTLIAATVFRERLSVRRWIGFAIGVVSTLFVSGTVSF
ncbi:MAG: EamA family transporter [Clostridia bacterium]|nr:EamA family transporter [Clostridia bacterium]